MSKKYLFIFFLIFSFVTHADFKEELLSPVNERARNPFLIGTGLTLVTTVFRPQVVEPFQHSTVSQKPLGHTTHYGDLMGKMIPNAIYILGMSFKSQDKAMVMLKATTYAGVIANLLKVTVREERPGSSSRSSFPSGHTTVAFAFASVIGELHGPFWGAPSYVLATFVGYSRINDNAHWLHDVIAGATLGIGYGLGISHLYKKNDTALTVFPTPIPGGYAMNVVYRF